MECLSEMYALEARAFIDGERVDCQASTVHVIVTTRALSSEVLWEMLAQKLLPNFVISHYLSYTLTVSFASRPDIVNVFVW